MKEVIVISGGGRFKRNEAAMESEFGYFGVEQKGNSVSAIFVRLQQTESGWSIFCKIYFLYALKLVSKESPGGIEAEMG